jgi:hypothetical protein
MKSTKPASSKSARKAAQKPEKVRGNMDYQKEIQPLIMAAREAWEYQDPGISFDDFRREEVMAAVGRDGLTACDHCHFCDLMGHFKTAAGKDDEALHWFLKGAKNAERQIAWSIAEILAKHIALAQSTVENLTATTPPRRLKKLLAARESLLDHPEGPLNFNDVLTIVRGKTRRQDLTLGEDLAKSLAERCDKLQLAQIRFTLINRISEREGRGLTADRNKSQRSDEAKRRRSPHELDDRRW